MQKLNNLVNYVFRLLKILFTKQNCCKCIVIYAIIISQKAFAQQASNSQADTSGISQPSSSNIAYSQVNDLHGKIFNTSSFSKYWKPIIMVFWYSVHKFLTKELDVFVDNYEQWKREAWVKILVISIEDSRTACNVVPVVNSRGWNSELYLDFNSDFKRARNINLVSQTFFNKCAGEIAWNTLGFMQGN